MLKGTDLKNLALKTLLLLLLEYLIVNFPKVYSIDEKIQQKRDDPATYVPPIPPILFKEMKSPIVGVGDICFGNNCNYYQESKDNNQSGERESYYSVGSKVTRFICILLSENVFIREKEADLLFERLNEYTETSELPFSYVEFYEKLGVFVIDVRSSIKEYEERSIFPLVEGLRLIRKLDILNKADCTKDSLLSEKSVFTNENGGKSIESYSNGYKWNWSSISNNFAAFNRLLKSEEAQGNSTNIQGVEYLTDEARLYKELDGYFLKKFNEASNLLNRLNMFSSSSSPSTNSNNPAISQSSFSAGRQSSVWNALSFLSNFSNKEDKTRFGPIQEVEDPLFGKMEPTDGNSKLTISPLYLLGMNLKGKNITELSQKFKNQTSPIIPVNMSREDVSLDNDLAMNIATVIFKGMSDSSGKLPPPFGNPAVKNEQKAPGYGYKNQINHLDANTNNNYYNSPSISNWSYKPIPQGNNNVIGGFESGQSQLNIQSDHFKGGSFHPSSSNNGIHTIDNSIVGFNSISQGNSNINSNKEGIHSQSGSGLAPSIFESIDTWGKQSSASQSNSPSSSPPPYYGTNGIKTINSSIVTPNGKNNPDLKAPTFNSPTTSEWMRKTISKQNEGGIKQPSFLNSQNNQTEINKSANSMAYSTSPIVNSNGNYFNSPLSQLSRLSNNPFHGNSVGTTFVRMNGSVFDDPNDITSFHPEEFINKLPEQVQKNMTQSQRDKINLINAFIGTGFDSILQMNNIDTGPSYGSQNNDFFRSSSQKRRLFEIDSLNRGNKTVANENMKDQNLSDQSSKEYEIYAKLLSNIDTNQGQDTAMAYVTGCDCDRFPEGVACPMVLSGEANVECIGYKVWNSARKGAPLSEVASAIDSAISSKARNIILPLKFDAKTIEDNRAAPRILRQIMRRTSKENGILFALPTGNNGKQELDGSLDFPCDDLTGMYAFCVGSISNKNGMPSSFSNIPQLNNAIYANGEDVESIGINQQRQLFSGTGIALAQSIGALNIIQGITKDRTSSFDQLAILYSAPKRLPSRSFLEQLFANSSPITFKPPQQQLQNQGFRNETSSPDGILMFGMGSGNNTSPGSSPVSHERIMSSSLMSGNRDNDLDEIMARIENIEKSLIKPGFEGGNVFKGEFPAGGSFSSSFSFTTTTTKTVTTTTNTTSNTSTHTAASSNPSDHSNSASTTTITTIEVTQISNSTSLSSSTTSISPSNLTTSPFTSTTTTPSITPTFPTPSSKFSPSDDQRERENYKESNYSPEIIGVVLDPKEVTEVSRLVQSSNEHYKDYYEKYENHGNADHQYDYDDGYRQYYINENEEKDLNYGNTYNSNESVPRNLCYEEETRFYSPLEMAIPVDNIEQCILSCSNTPDCRYYSYGAFLKGPGSIIGTCILMPDKQGSVALPNFQSGALGCPVSASIAYAQAMEERLIQGISNANENNQKSSSAQVNKHLSSDWPGILSTSTVAVKSMSGFLSRFPLNDILQTSISLYNSGFLDQKGALRPSGAFEKQSILPPPGVGSPHVVCTLQGMQCCVPQKSAKGWRKKPPSFLRVEDPSCEAIYVSKTDMFCATTSLYDNQDISSSGYNLFRDFRSQSSFSSNSYSSNPKPSGNCGMVIIETSEHLIFQNTLKMPSKEMNNALCECKLNKRDKSIHGSGTWEYSVQAVQAAMSRKVEGDQLSSGVAQALAWVEAVGNDPNPAVNGLGELISQVAQRPNSDVELITQIPAISQNAVSNMLYNQQQQQIEEQEQIIKKQQSIQEYNNMRYLASQFGTGTNNTKIQTQFDQQCVTSWPEKCQVWKSKCEDNLIYGYRNPQCAPLTILENGCPMKQVGFKVNQVNPGILSFSFKPMRFSDNSPFRIACQFSLIKCSLANIKSKCKPNGINSHKKSKNLNGDDENNAISNIRKHLNNHKSHNNSSTNNLFYRKDTGDKAKNNDLKHLFKIPMNYLPFVPKGIGENDKDSENIIEKYIRVHFPQAGNFSNMTMVKLLNKDTKREFAAKMISEDEIPKNNTIEDVLIDESSNFEYLGKIEIVSQDEKDEDYSSSIKSENITDATSTNRDNLENKQLIFSHLLKESKENKIYKEPLLLDKYQPDFTGESFPEFKMEKVVIPDEPNLESETSQNYNKDSKSRSKPGTSEKKESWHDHQNKNGDLDEYEDLYYYGFENDYGGNHSKNQISDFIPFISSNNKNNKWEIQINKSSGANRNIQYTIARQNILFMLACFTPIILMLGFI
ncbi:large extracellular with a signal peptide [Cryptosporidium sp. chipmunk genotype I]|uniref:large extracellular with a signal peptide n=1 Tax=Cryptosporidium sp. chipmunk genotype I TaxID=1280935 RepID=UPI00351AA067|nr:large extracellular with a signal peptide [Cryptosporidium sp. chipmunk genotype I]